MLRIRKRNQNLSVAANMPPLRHSFSGETFNPKKSEVIKWLIDRPTLLQYLFDSVKNKEIVYNPETDTWRGVDYDGD